MNNKEELVISEKFYSIQGEGQTMGVPSIFVRLAGCNLLCESPSWVCDSIEVWKKGFPTEFKYVLSDDDVYRIKNGTHLIFTGGEPLLHQFKIVKFIKWFQEEYKYIPTVEIETNGTLRPSVDLLDLVSFWNCSPKLSNSGESKERRINKKAISDINKAKGNVIFKFVVEKDTDVIEIVKDYGELIDKEKIVLMPAGESKGKLNETRKVVVQQCLNLGLRYSDRLHIVIWNQKTGV